MAGRRNKIAFKFALHCCIIKTTFGGVSTDRNLHQEPDCGGVRALIIETIVALPTVSVPPQ